MSTEWGDARCTHPDLRTTTDSAGAFRLPGVRIHSDFLLIIPGFDMASPSYSLCTSVGDTLWHAFEGYGTLTSHAPTDSLDCLEWRWQARQRVTCSGLRLTALVSGGAWTGERGEGSYRLILDHDTVTPPGHHKPLDRRRVFVQWLEPLPDGGTRVVRTERLPIARKIDWIDSLRLRHGPTGRWCAEVRGEWQVFTWDVNKPLDYLLGPPGEMRHVKSCIAEALSPSRVDTFRLTMPQLAGRERTIRVYLPPGYDGSSARFPVLYLQDAQNLFAPGMFGDWLVDETIDRLVYADSLRALIVVGIDNSEHRLAEYSPWVDSQLRAWLDSAYFPATDGGEGDAYLRFITNTLKPEIDRRYRTLTGREETGIGGSSMGGVIALYAGLVRPDVFSKVMAMSPAVWFTEDGGAWLSHNRLVALVREHPVPSDVRFYVDVGTSERSRATDPDVVDSVGKRVTYPRAYLEGAQAVVDALRAAGVPDSRLRFVVDSGAEHNERAWARRLPGALEWLFR